MAHHQRVPGAAGARAVVRRPAGDLCGARRGPRPPDGQGRGRDGGLGPRRPSAAAQLSSLSAPLGEHAEPRIESGVSIGIQDSLDELVERVAIERAAGYRRIKIKIKPGWDVARGRAHPRAVRRPSAADGRRERRLHARGRAAARRARPVRPDDDRAAARLRRHPRPRPAPAPSCGRAICLDESIHSVRAAAEAIELGACRIINIKPGRVGGHAESLRLHDLAAAHGDSGLARRHARERHRPRPQHPPLDAAELLAARRRRRQSPLLRPRPHRPEIVVRPDGTIAVPTGPGIGVHIVTDRVAAATEEKMELRV